jgi:isopenicillin-N epimerase
LNEAPSPDELRKEFFLDPSVTFLNHGSSSARPRAVIEAYQAWQRALEREPVDFVERQLPLLLDGVRDLIARYVHAPARDVTLIQNATTGVNIAARSLDLRPGDEILTTDLEYGACEKAWEWLCERVGARLVRVEIPLPVDDVVGRLFAQRTSRTRAVYISHVTSATGLRLPVEEAVAAAKAQGLVSIVDGAHAIAQLDVNVGALGADFYAENCHKWLLAPRGTGFLYVDPHFQDRVDGAVINWGYVDEPRTFISRTEEQGTRDVVAHLAVPAAIAFQQERSWPSVRRRCYELARTSRARLCALLGTEPICSEDMLLQMATVRLPSVPQNLRQRLFDDHRIEVAVDRHLLRISVAAYTTEAELEYLLDVLPGYF